MSSSKKDIINYYNQTEYDYRVAWYKDDNPALHFGMYDKSEADAHYDALMHTNKVLAMNAHIQDGHDILDAGCGLGGSTFWLASTYKVNVVGISLPENQIQHCQEQAEKRQFKGSVSFIQADYTQTPFPENSFDVIWACESVCHATQKIDFYREAFRLLRPGGRIVLAEYLRNQRPLPKKEEKLLTNKWLNNWAIADIDTEPEHLNNLKRAGFKHCHIENVNDRVRVSLRNLHEKCTRSVPIESVLRLFRFRTKIQHGNLVGSINQYRAFKKNLWSYCIITAAKPND